MIKNPLNISIAIWTILAGCAMLSKACFKRYQITAWVNCYLPNDGGLLRLRWIDFCMKYTFLKVKFSPSCYVSYNLSGLSISVKFTTGGIKGNKVSEWRAWRCSYYIPQTCTLKHELTQAEILQETSSLSLYGIHNSDLFLSCMLWSL